MHKLGVGFTCEVRSKLFLDVCSQIEACYVDLFFIYCFVTDLRNSIKHTALTEYYVI